VVPVLVLGRQTDLELICIREVSNGSGLSRQTELDLIFIRDVSSGVLVRQTELELIFIREVSNVSTVVLARHTGTELEPIFNREASNSAGFSAADKPGAGSVDRIGAEDSILFISKYQYRTYLVPY
jgi:hypothetical protein